MSRLQTERCRVGRAAVSALTAGAGEPVVLLHGIPTGADLWIGVGERLAASGLRVLAPDLPGYGRTRLAPSGDHSLAGAADLLDAWMGEQGLEEAWIVGHDAGGGVAQILAVAHPQRVTRLTLVDSIVDGSWPALRARFATAVARLGLYRPAAALGIVPNPYLRWQIRRGFADPGRSAEVDATAVFWDGKFSQAAGRRAFQAHLAALDPADTARIVPGLSQLQVPCQLVWGDRDVFQPWEVAGRRLRRLLPDPEEVVLAGCGHFVPLECPERLVAALLRWRAEVAA